MINNVHTASDAMLDVLVDEGIDTIFGIPGVHNLPIYDALAQRSDIRHVLARHEQGAGFMADGFARATSDVGVALVISGPGVTNVLTPLAGAYAESSGLLVIATGLPDRKGEFLGELHELRDQFAAAAAVAGWARRVDRPEDVADAVREAIHALRSGRPRGAYLEISIDALPAEAETPDLQAPRSPSGAALPSDRDVEAVRAALVGAAKPLIMAGSGVKTAAGAAALRVLGERLGAPVVLGPKSCHLLPGEDPSRIVLPRFHDNEQVNTLISAADVVVSVGTNLGFERTSRQHHVIKGTHLRINIDAPDSSVYAFDADYRYDASAFLVRLAEGLDGTAVPWFDGAAVRASLQTPVQRKYGDHLGFLDAIREVLPDDGVLVADITMLGSASTEYWTTPTPHTYFHPNQLCSIGHGFALGLGIKVARPEVPVVIISGDGGVLQTLWEIVSAIQEGIVATVVIFNDNAYTAVKRGQVKGPLGRAFATDLESPDFTAFGKSLGISSLRASTPSELADALRTSLGTGKISLIEVPIGPFA